MVDTGSVTTNVNPPKPSHQPRTGWTESADGFLSLETPILRYISVLARFSFNRKQTGVRRGLARTGIYRRN